jgi:Mrp family chromosome partitioning ATPase/capsular polysaccharide biosynthesis protein
MDLVRYLRVLRRHWRVIVILAVLGAAAGAVLVPKPKPEGAAVGGTAWIAVHTLFDSSVNNKTAGSSFATVTAEQAAFLVKSGDVPDRVAQEIGGNSADLSAKVVARPNSNLGTIEVTAQGTSPGEARKLSDAFAESLLSSVRDIQQREIDRNRDVLTGAIAQLELEVVGITGDDRVANLARERINAQIIDKRQQLQELDRRFAQGTNIYSFGSSEAFQVTPGQLDSLFNAEAANPSGQPNRNRAGSTRDLRNEQPEQGIELNPVMGAILGFALGGLAGVMLVLVINALDPRIFTKEDAEDALGFPVIAEIPAFNRKLRKETIVISREAPYSRFAEAYRVLRSSVLFANSEAGNGPANGNGGGNGAATSAADVAGAHGTDEHRQQAVVIMVTSPGPSEGKTTTVSNLATVLAEDGSSILVVNCDFRRPRLHSYLGGGGEPRKVFDTAVPGVKLVTGVVDEPERVAPAEVIVAQRRLILTAKNHFDFILLDTAPMLTTNDASELLQVVDMVVMITRSAKTTKESADRAAELLERFRAPVVGGVLVAAANAPTRQYYYYYAASGPKPATEPESTNPLEDLKTQSKRRGSDEESGVGARSRRRDTDAMDGDDMPSDAARSSEEPPEA